MKPHTRFLGMACLLATAAASLFLSSAISTQAAPAGADGAGADGAKSVEPDMHEFMEYVFQPTFRRLQKAMAAEPGDNSAWKSIKADSLILAEGGNLLLIRQPEEDAADWAKHSVQVRESGGQLYRSAKSKGFAAARKHYETMVMNCNACHRQFADGEHILKP